MLNRCTVLIVASVVSACASAAQLPLSAGVGPQPNLPPPKTSVLPLVKVATAKGWPAGGKPIAAEGTTVAAFAQGLEHPRWLYVLPNGDVLVAETNAPKRPDDNKGIKGWFFDRFQKQAGGGVPSPNRITLLRDSDGDGIAETRSVFASGLNSPFGMNGSRGHSLGVKGTPTVFLNGREVPFESLPAEKLRVVIQSELTAAGQR